MPPPAQKVFNIAELLEMILSRLDHKTLWKSARLVGSDWKDIIDKPHADLRQALFLDPAPRKLWNYDALYGRDYGHEGPDGVSTGHVAISELTKDQKEFLDITNVDLDNEQHFDDPFDPKIFHPITPFELNELLFSPGAQVFWSTDFTKANSSLWVHETKFRPHFDTRKHLSGRWEEMLLTQPPPVCS